MTQLTMPDGTVINVNDDEIWSCNPADIRPWEPDDIDALRKALGQVFKWKDTPEQKVYEIDNDIKEMIAHFNDPIDDWWIERSGGPEAWKELQDLAEQAVVAQAALREATQTDEQIAEWADRIVNGETLNLQYTYALDPAK